jgi:hypothetical protein
MGFDLDFWDYVTFAVFDSSAGGVLIFCSACRAVLPLRGSIPRPMRPTLL